MVRTRSRYDTDDLISIPIYDEIIYVSCSELFSAFNNDYIDYIISLKNPEFKEKHWESIMDKSYLRSQACNQFFIDLSSTLTDASSYQFVGKRRIDDGLLRQDYQFLYKIHFCNKLSHVNGIIDGLMRIDLVSSYLSVTCPERTKPYVMIYIHTKKSPLTRYHRLKVLGQLYYFSRLYDEVEDNFVVVVFPHSHEILYQNEKDVETIKDLVMNIRKAKKIAPFLDYNAIAHPKYYPNMNTGKDSPHYTIKKQISDKVGEITQIWGCDDTHKQRAFGQGVYSWRDERFSPYLVGFTDAHKIHILNRILSVNRQSPEDPDFQWMQVDADFHKKWPILFLPTSCEMYYIDFEYLENGMLYLIGVFYKGHYRSFWAESLSDTGESALLRLFHTYLSQLSPDSIIWYWHAERSKWQSRCRKYGLFESVEMTYNWSDMCHLMRSGTVAVFGAFSFGLKDVVNAFYHLRKIPFHYQGLDCGDGKSSIRFALRYYHERDPLLKDTLEKYNRMDCEAMSYLLREILAHTDRR